jgi:exodeoxyribonuclease V alpha subunit
MESIYGYVERITFQNPENGYTIAHLQEPGRKATTCIVGTLPSVRPGETVRCFGQWKQHLIHGRQFVVSECRMEAPADLVGIKKYLGSGLIKGIGPKYAARIVEKFGVDTLNIIETDPKRLLDIDGLGPKRLSLITNCWTDQKSIREVMIFLQGHGVSPAFAQKIYKKYGNESIHTVKDNPHGLARDVHGIGFKTADTIAQNLGVAKDSPKRIDAGIEFVLSELAGDGHVCFPVSDFLLEAEKILEAPGSLIESRLANLKDQRRIELFDLIHGGKQTKFVWGIFLFMAEVGIANEIQRLQQAACRLWQVDVPKALDWV